MHGEVESFDKVEPLRQLGKADDSDLGDIRKGVFTVGLLLARSRALPPEAEEGSGHWRCVFVATGGAGLVRGGGFFVRG